MYDEEPDLRPLLEFLDRLRETTEIAIDEAKGQYNHQQITVLQQSTSSSSNKSYSRTNTPNRKHIPIAVAMSKPQTQFNPPIDNSRDTIFIPSLPKHGLPLTNSIHNSNSSSSSSLSSSLSSSFIHPYKHFIDHIAYPEEQLNRADPVAPFITLEENECDFINTIDDLILLCQYLEGKADLSNNHHHQSKSYFNIHESSTLRYGPNTPVREIAIDLEAHSYRSFQGFTCLMQLSTRERDFLIDTIALRSHLHLLNTVTTDPRIVKVLHGCDSDIVWLQRDFGIYIINIFDTGQASRILAYPSFSLAYLLDLYPKITASKEYQTADWRQRPLPAELLKYAREDTHYLLGIYDRLKNELINNSSSSIELSILPKKVLGQGYTSSTKDLYENIMHGKESKTVLIPSLLVEVLKRSNDKALFLYEKEVFYPYGYRKLMLKLGIGFVTNSTNITGKINELDDETMDNDNNELSNERNIIVPDLAVKPWEDPNLNPQARIFAALYEWRDRIARVEDESIPYVLPNRVLYRITLAMPSTVDLLTQTCNPLPPIVRSRMDELVRIINAARDCIPINTDSTNTATNNTMNNHVRHAGHKRNFPPDTHELSNILKPNSIPIVERVNKTSQAMEQILNILMKINLIENNDVSPDNNNASLLPLSVKQNGGWLQPPMITLSNSAVHDSTNITSTLFSTFASNSTEIEEDTNNNHEIAQNIKHIINQQSWKQLLGIRSFTHISTNDKKENDVPTNTKKDAVVATAAQENTISPDSPGNNDKHTSVPAVTTNLNSSSDAGTKDDDSSLPLSLAQQYPNNNARKKRKQSHSTTVDIPSTSTIAESIKSNNPSSSFNYDQPTAYGLINTESNAKSAKFDLELNKKENEKQNLGKRNNHNYTKKNPFLRR